MQEIRNGAQKIDPNYAQSNGFAERNVQTAKNMTKKCLSNNKQSIHLALLHHRNTPIRPGFPSPSELANGRKLRSNLPTMKSSLIPSSYNMQELSEKYEEEREKMAKRYNQTSRILEPLELGQPIWFQDQNK